MDKSVKCVICKHGETENGFTTVTLEKNDSTIVFKHVPAHVCDNCGEKYVDSEVTAELFIKAQSITGIFVVTSLDEARKRVESARQSDDYMSEKEYQIEMNTFWNKLEINIYKKGENGSNYN